MNKEELAKVLEEHKNWLNGEGGRRASGSWRTACPRTLHGKTCCACSGSTGLNRW
jgi:hypothetical protein